MIFEYIETFYNNKRRQSYLGYCSPNQFELIYKDESCLTVAYHRD